MRVIARDRLERPNLTATGRRELLTDHISRSRRNTMVDSLRNIKRMDRQSMILHLATARYR